MEERKYPVGIQTFSRIIREGMVYVDKTDLVWQLANHAKYIFLSRPRRFGKSLLTSTLESYFRGEKEHGYHFSGKSPDIYNPYSLFSAFANQKVSNYWFETGTPTFLIQMLRKFKYDITSMDDIESTDYAINRPTEGMTTMIPLLYQSGYLTIKDYDRETDIYTLGIPNQEVRIGYADGLLPTYSGLEGE